jgi:hypothetical protein
MKIVVSRYINVYGASQFKRLDRYIRFLRHKGLYVQSWRDPNYAGYRVVATTKD